MTVGNFVPTPRTTPTRLAERVGYDRATAHAVLDEAVVAHVGFVVDGRPVVLPLSTVAGTPVPDPELPDGVEVPEHVRQWHRRRPETVG